MKKKLFVVLGFLLVLGLFFTACSSDDSSNDPFEGTWATNEGTQIVAANGVLKSYRNDHEAGRATYTFSGNVVSAKTTEVNLEVIGGTGWVSCTSQDEI
jgi:hypothetical protein